MSDELPVTMDIEVAINHPERVLRKVFDAMQAGVTPRAIFTRDGQPFALLTPLHGEDVDDSDPRGGG